MEPSLIRALIVPPQGEIAGGVGSVTLRCGRARKRWRIDSLRKQGETASGLHGLYGWLSHQGNEITCVSVEQKEEVSHHDLG